MCCTIAISNWELEPVVPDAYVHSPAPGDYAAMDKTLTFTEDGMQCAWFYPKLDAEKEDREWFTYKATGSGSYENFSLDGNFTIRKDQGEETLFEG